MSYKQANALIMLASQAIIVIWLVIDATGARSAERSAAEVATGLLWAVGAMIVFNFVAVIVVSILAGVFARAEFKDERADERDRMVTAKSMRNAYLAISVGGLGVLLMLALGVTPVAAVYALFGALMLGGAADSVSQLVYYRYG